MLQRADAMVRSIDFTFYYVECVYTHIQTRLELPGCTQTSSSSALPNANKGNEKGTFGSRYRDIQTARKRVIDEKEKETSYTDVT